MRDRVHAPAGVPREREDAGESTGRVGLVGFASVNVEDGDAGQHVGNGPTNRRNEHRWIAGSTNEDHESILWRLRVRHLDRWLWRRVGPFTHVSNDSDHLGRKTG